MSLTPRDTTAAAVTIPALPGVPGGIDPTDVVAQMVRRAASPGFESWWKKAENAGFCANPIHLSSTDTFGRQHQVWTRCNNRRTVACPSCSDLYGRDTWQLVHAGLHGGHHQMPTTIAEHPQVFVTLTAPSFGAVHTTRDDSHRAPAGRCHDPGLSGYRRCPHGKPLWCSIIHSNDDAQLGQPLCEDCYDYTGHVLFAWHAPELWRRFTISLRRLLDSRLRAIGEPTKSVRLNYVKVTEMQRRAIPHFHAVIRLDGPPVPGEPPRTPVSSITATDLAVLVQHAARAVTVTVTDPKRDDDGDGDGDGRTLRFGRQADTQSLNPARPDAGAPPRSGRSVAAYLAKYVTKSVAEFGVGIRRMSPLAVAELDVTAHVRAILTAITSLADHRAYQGMDRWLHTLGYRGHITTKSRLFSTTMGALRAYRAAWTRQQHTDHAATSVNGDHRASPSSDPTAWEFERVGMCTLGDRALILSAAQRMIEHRHTARDNLGAHDPPAHQDWTT
jgi:hypothetical protein